MAKIQRVDEDPEEIWSDQPVLKRHEQRALITLACGASQAQTSGMIGGNQSFVSRTLTFLREYLDSDNNAGLVARAIAGGLIDMDGPVGDGEIITPNIELHLRRFRGVTKILGSEGHGLTEPEIEFLTAQAAAYSKTVESAWKNRMPPAIAARLLTRLMVPRSVHNPFILLWSAGVYLGQVEPVEPVPFSQSVHVAHNVVVSIDGPAGTRLVFRLGTKRIRLGVPWE